MGDKPSDWKTSLQLFSSNVGSVMKEDNMKTATSFQKSEKFEKIPTAFIASPKRRREPQILGNVDLLV